jgi:hypothetical protein
VYIVQVRHAHLTYPRLGVPHVSRLHPHPWRAGTARCLNADDEDDDEDEDREGKGGAVGGYVGRTP